MGKKPAVKLLIDAERLRSIVKGKLTLEEIGNLMGVTKQAVKAWFDDGAVRPRVLAEIVKAADISVDNLEEILAPQYNRKVKITIHLEDA